MAASRWKCEYILRVFVLTILRGRKGDTNMSARLVSMTLGRPPSIMVNDDIPLPAAIDDEYLDTQQPPGVVSRNLFTAENIKMTKILGMILRRIYHPPPREQPSQPEFPDLNTLLDLDSLLQKTEEAIPVALNWDHLPQVPLSARSQLLRRQANVLHAR